MKLKVLAFTLALAPLAARAQSAPTARQALELSAFGGGTATYTGLKLGKNGGITAGIDLRVLKLFSFDPSIEIRGNYPIHDGIVDAQKSVLGGIKLQKTYFFRVRPYVDILYGRGEIDYESGGYPSLDRRYFYVQTPSNVISPGAGVDVDLSPHFAVKGDIQLQRWDTPVTASGTIWAKPITLGMVYRFDFNDRHHRR